MQRISLLGDICGGDMNYKIGWGIHSKYFGEESSRQLEFNSFFKSSEMVLSNLESPLSGQPVEGRSFLASDKFVSFLKKENLHYFTIANNHILDHGPEVYEETKRILDENNMYYVGDCNNHLSNAHIYQNEDLKIGICGFNSINTEVNNHNYAAFDLQKIKESIDFLKTEKKADLIIVSLHWGLEYIQMPSEDQITMAREIIDMGADIIHGHHPHVIMPFEKYKEGYIFYSLGNFLMDIDWWPPTKKGLIVDFIFEGKKIHEFDLYYSQIKKGKLKLEKLKNKERLTLQEDKVIETRNYLKKQRNRLKLQKIFSYLYLVINFYKLSSQTKSMLTSGLKSKIKFEKN